MGRPWGDLRVICIQIQFWIKSQSGSEIQNPQRKTDLSAVPSCVQGKYTYVIFTPSGTRRWIFGVTRGTRAHRRFDIVKKARGRWFLAAGALGTDGAVAVLGFGVKENDDGRLKSRPGRASVVPCALP